MCSTMFKEPVSGKHEHGHGNAIVKPFKFMQGMSLDMKEIVTNMQVHLPANC